MIKTIADFKRTMLPGTMWETTHQYIGQRLTEEKSLGTRKCVLNRLVGFCFKTERGFSHYPWPKRAEFSVENDGRTVVITREGFVRLKYTKVG